MNRRHFLRATGAAAVMGPAMMAGESNLQSVAPRANPLLKFFEAGGNAGTAASDAGRDFFYRPANAWAADFIPFYARGSYQLFYLHDWRDKSKFGEGTPWYLISTNDFVNYKEHGEVLARGTTEQQDLFVFTGSVIEAQGQYHIFYTGHNPHFRKQNKPEQGVMHATSTDLLKWKKIPENTFYAPPETYEPHDWRDPFVFWNEDAREYWMLLAARFKKGPSRRRGLTALCSSKDLQKWVVRDPFWAPSLYYTHECPDLFKIGEWWYLVFSEFTDYVRTQYRMSRSLGGPWHAPRDPFFDGRAFYAAKTASDGRRRFIFGWDPTRQQSRDYTRWDWGGNLVVHEIHQEKNGELRVSVPDTVDRAFARSVPFQFASSFGNVKSDNGVMHITAPDSFGATSAAGQMPERCKIEATIEFDNKTRSCGVMLRVSDDLESAYYVRLEPMSNRLVFDSWPRGATPGHPITNTDGHFMLDMERPLHIRAGEPVNMKIFVDGTVCVVYANDRIAMSTRLYNISKGSWGLFVQDGRARFRNLSISLI